NSVPGEDITFHAEDAILLCQMQSLRDCCEGVLTVCLEQKDVTYHKLLVLQHEIAAWKALVLEGTHRY
ncbi:MAG: hypothetical protein MUD01_06630, partial [Chloroflexaceae bacterium]|nr:hypothetical protein [Chloroflexaceae bacterium]